MSERSAPGAGGPTRRVRAGGYTWTVYELPPCAVREGRTSLVFVRDHVARRVWNYPTDWLTLSEEALANLAESC